MAALIFSLLPQRCLAVNASPTPVQLQQPDGTQIVLRARGDEWFHWYEDSNGYTAVVDQGTYYYAQLDANGKLAPTAFQVGKSDPQQAGLAVGILPFRTTIAQTRAAFAAPAGVVAPKPVAPSGNVKNLVILCKFSDHTFGVQTRQESDFDTLMNKIGGDPTLAPTGSLKDYYLETSYGIVTLNSTVVVWVTLPQTEAYYCNGQTGFGNYPRNAQGMVEDALKLADAFVDFGQFDTDGDGYVDAIDIIHSGYAAETGGGGGNWIWSHKWSLYQLPGGEFTSNDNNSKGVKVKVYDYHTEAALWGTSGNQILRVGVIAHETGHFFGLPDLYDTDNTSEGIGSYCLMANSWGFDGTQLHPPQMSAWSKIQLGWATAMVISKGTYVAPRVNTTPTIYQINHGYPSGEYLLIENRQTYGFESMPQGGLVIWHIDDAKANNNSEGYPGQAGWPANNNHYHIAVLAADGKYDMEKGNNRGDGGDVYHGNGVSSISTNTVPNTQAYKNGTILSTSNSITAISVSGVNMSFTFNDGTTNANVPAVSVAAGSVMEGDVGLTNLTFLVTLFPAANQPVTVDFSLSGGTATPDVDYVNTNGRVFFPAGITSQSITVPVIGDTVFEANETFVVTLSNPTNCTISVTNATGTIINDDTVLLPPVITAVSTNAGPVGATVTITGANFSPSPSKDLVRFGAVQATVTSAATNQLQVTVPAGATFAPISVTVGGYTDNSLAPFMVTFNSSATIDTNTFVGRIDVSTGLGSRSVVIADLDGDGRVDMATVDTDANTVTILRNINTSSTINGASFGAKQTLAAGSAPVAITAADVDGDGLLDLIVADYNGATVSVYLNQSTSGSIAFQNRVDFSTGSNPRDVAVVDIDGDDRPEIVVACETDGKIQILQNLSTPGFLDTGSFGSAVSFVVGKSPAAVAVADIDGDGREDIVVANSFNGVGGNSITLLRNTSTLGVIDTQSLAARVSFNAGAGPASLAIGDLDGDGKLDIVTGNTLANSMSIFRNTAASGSLDSSSLAPKVDVSSGSPIGGLRQVVLGDINGDGLPDLVCVNQTISTLSVLRNQFSGNSLDASSFATPVSYGMASSPTDVALVDWNRDGRLELVSVSSGVVSIRRNLLKLNPLITWSAPAAMAYGDKLTTNQLNAVASVLGAFIYYPPTGTVVTASIQTLQATFIPADPSLYNITTTTVPLTVNKGIPVISWSNPADITYGTALSNSQLNATATFNSLPVAGTFDYSPPAGTILDAGAGQILSVTFTPTDTNNLSVVGPTTVSINVNKATPVITWSNPADIVYGTPLGVTQLNATVKNMGQSVAGSFAYNPDTNTVLSVGTNQALTLTFTPANSGNFDAPAMATVHINVTKAPLGIRANDITRLHGANNPTLTATYYGLVNGDVGASLTTDVTLQTTADSSSPIGDYVITASGATSPNYTITFTNGTLHVTGDDPPVIAFDAEGQNYYENAPPVILDPAVSVTDAGSPDFDGGVFTISLTSGARTTDQLSIVPGGLDADEVTLSGTNVLVGGVTIGWYEGGTNGSTPLVVHLNTNAVPANTQALARRLAFVNISEDPGSDTRIVQLVLSDGDGGTNSPATLPIYVFPENDLPTITLLTPTNGASFIAPGPVTFTVSAADVDGTVVKVKYYDGDTFLGCSTTGPDFAFTWNSASLGSGGSIYAVACDNEGGETSTDTISLTFLPGITSPGFNQEGGHFQMTFVGVASTFYDVLWSADLIHWNYLKTILGTGSATTIVDETSTGTEPARFYQFVPHIAIKPERP